MKSGFETRLKRIAILALLAGGLSSAGGLSAGCGPVIQKKHDRENFFFPVSKYEPDPVYNRIMPVYLPNPLPRENKEVESAPRIFPVIQFEVKGATLEEAAMILAHSTRYQSYCASSIAQRRVTFAGLGTVDELAQRIADAAKIDAVVDHENREVRFLSKAAL